MRKLFELVVTGGPCSGKTTFLSKAEQIFSKHGFTVIVVPETATELILSGLRPSNLPLEVFQELVIDRSLNKEDTTRKAVEYFDTDVIIFYDRGILDSKAYMPHEMFIDILGRRGLTEIGVRDNYSAILHLVTAAIGAEHAYTCANNKARTETLEEARVLDTKTRDSWVGAPHLHIVGNQTSFDKKIDRLVEIVYSIIGLPVPLEIERKYLIKKPDVDFLISMGAVKQEIIQIYLKSDEDVERRIRQRGLNGVFSYYYTEKRKITELERVETEVKIKEKEYLKYLMEADKFIRKNRYCMPYMNQYLEIDIYPSEAWKDMAILEIELTNKTLVPTIPDWLELIKEVTDEPKYKNYNLAKDI